MKANELKHRTIEELNRMLIDSRHQLRELRFNLTAGKVKNIRAIQLKKKEIARILTVLHEKTVENKNKNKKA